MPAAVILVHGLRTSATMWRRQVEELERRGIPVIAVDLPGHGTRIAERFTLESALAAIDDAVGAATASTGTRPYLVGFSLGGYLSIEWVAAHRDRVCGLLAASCGTVPNRVVMGTWRVLARAIHALPDRGRALNDFALKTFVSSPGADDVLAGGVALEVMDDVLRALLSLHPTDRLRSIEVPIAFVNGRFDHVALQARRFLAASQNGRLVTIPRATHMVSVTHPDEFTNEMMVAYRSATRDARLPDDAPGW